MGMAKGSGAMPEIPYWKQITEDEWKANGMSKTDEVKDIVEDQRDDSRMVGFYQQYHCI